MRYGVSLRRSGASVGTSTECVQNICEPYPLFFECVQGCAELVQSIVDLLPPVIDLFEAVGDLTAMDRETLSLVLRAGGTVTAAEFAEQLGAEQTTAGNRLVTLHKKGYLQRVERPHPFGDQFVDPRSVRFDLK